MFLFVLYTFSQQFKTKLKYLMEFSWISANFLVTTTKYFHLQIFPAKTYQNPFVNTFSPDPDKEHGKHSHILRYLPTLEGELAKKKTTLYIYDFPNMQNYLSNLSNSHVLKYTYSTLQSRALNKLSALLRVQSHSPPAKFLGNNIFRSGQSQNDI